MLLFEKLFKLVLYHDIMKKKKYSYNGSSVRRTNEIEDKYVDVCSWGRHQGVLWRQFTDINPKSKNTSSNNGFDVSTFMR